MRRKSFGAIGRRFFELQALVSGDDGECRVRLRGL